MTTIQKSSRFVDLTLQTFFTINIIGFIAATGMMFIAKDACGVRVAGICSLSMLTAAIGGVQLFRRVKIGYYGIAASYIVAIVVLSTLFGDWINRQTGGTGTAVVIATAVFLLILLTYVVFIHRSGDGNLWKGMSTGIDLKHFRHIYQLSGLLAAGVACGMIFIHSGGCEEATKTETGEIEKPVVKSIPSIALLDSASVTLEEITVIEENMPDSISPETREVYEGRIYALKHLMLSGLMADGHDAGTLSDIANIHTGEFSSSQQEILDWFVALPEEDKLRWNYCPRVLSLREFKQKMTELISKTGK